MNKRRREAIYSIINKLILMKKTTSDNVDAELEAVYKDIEFIFDEEENYMDSIPENMQSGYRYEKAEDACDNLQEAKDSIYEAKENYQNAEEMTNCIDFAIKHLRNAAL